MSYLHVFAVILGLVGVVPAVTLLSPVKIEHRAVPAIMITLSIVLWFLPAGIDFALAAVPVAAYISAKLGIEHAGHEPANYAPAVEKTRAVVQAAREKVRPSKPIAVTEFVKKAYPDPSKEAPEIDNDTAAEDDVQDVEPEDAPEPTLQDKLEMAAKGLPSEFQAKLAGRRAGRDLSVGLRNSTVSTVRKFVPSLLD
jgi:hypothetical protein